MSASYTGTDQLYFYEEIMLLALREEDGKVEVKTYYEYQSLVAAALLAELVILGRAKITDPKKHTVELTSSEPTGNDLLDHALSMVVDSKKVRSASHWLGKFAYISKLRERAAASLCERGILKAEEGTVFFFFDKTYYPELNPRPELKLISRLEKAIFGTEKVTDERTIVLLALLRKSELLKVPFEAKALREQRHRMKDICENQLVGDAANAAAEAAQTAVMMAAIMPAMTAAVIAT